MSGSWYHLIVHRLDPLGRLMSWDLYYDQQIRDRLEARDAETSLQLARLAQSLRNGTYRIEPPGYLVAPV